MVLAMVSTLAASSLDSIKVILQPRGARCGSCADREAPAETAEGARKRAAAWIRIADDSSAWIRVRIVTAHQVRRANGCSSRRSDFQRNGGLAVQLEHAVAGPAGNLGG